jgi:hypothetical protein
MNEQVFASQLRRALDESAERLPYRVTQRLEAARLAALARMRPLAAPQLAVAGGDAGGWLVPDRPSVAFRLLSTLVPLLLVAFALYGIVLWDDARNVADTAEIDAELLLEDDEIPIAAYADKGFGVYIRNVRQ